MSMNEDALPAKIVVEEKKGLLCAFLAKIVGEVIWG